MSFSESVQVPLFTCFILLIASVFNPVLATEIQVQSDRNPVNLQESFQLIFTANESPDEDPDFSPLKKDFEILNQSTQQSTQIVNWKSSKTIQWIITVMAKHEGKLVVPSIAFGKDKSLLAVVVVNKAQAADNNNRDLFLQVSVNTPTPYIQEQVIYTLKLFRKVNISGASLTEPVLENAVIVRLDEDKNYETQHNGENYVVVERHYAIFPQKSGKMSIAPLTLTAGIIMTNQRRRSSFFNQQSSRQQRIQSEAIQLDVKAQASEFTAPHWLIAEQVYIEEKWSTELDNITVGEPITRTLSLYVQGATVSTLPDLQQDNLPPQIKAYPDQPVVKEAPKNGSLLAFREEKIALIPTEAGSFTLPEIRIPWWNKQSQQQETAIFPAKTLTAIAGLTTKPAIQALPVLSPPVDNSVDNISTVEEKAFWKPLALFFGTAWLITLIYLVWHKLKPKTLEKTKPAIKQSAFIEKIFKQACQQHDKQKAKTQLLLWSDKATSLEELAKQCPTELAEAIRELNTLLYSHDTENWQGDALWIAFQNNKQSSQETKTQQDALEPLFKL